MRSKKATIYRYKMQMKRGLYFPYKGGDNLYKYNYPYKIYARDVINELSKSNDEEVISKFIIELCKLSKLKQYKKYNTKMIKCILYDDNKRMK